MADVDLIAKVPFSYATRRLKAGDSFTVPAPMARVLEGIGKAERPREPGKVAPPPREVVERVTAAARKPAAKPATSTRKAPAKRRTRAAKK